MKQKVLKYIIPLLFVFALLLYVTVLLRRQTEGFVSKCPIGSWCPKEDPGKSYPCKGGRYGSSDKNISPECDGACDAGCVCERGSKKACPKFCPKGYFCPKGTETPKLCPEGFYCPERTADPVPCPKERKCIPGTDAI